jgi:DNA-3-methyladenine glycosylase
MSSKTRNADLLSKPLITSEFFRRDPLVCARELIGCEMVWQGCGGMIVETEAYSVCNDEACHTFARPSSRDFVARSQSGSAYVYLNYGVHWLFNFLVKGGREDGFVLIRALEPTTGLDAMTLRRNTGCLKNLCSGPGKLARALDISGQHHGADFLGDKNFHLRAPGVGVSVVAGPRIGITKSAELPWRFTLEGSRFLSVKNSSRVIDR